MEWVEQHIGTGDGVTCCFNACVNHRPIEEGTLKVFVFDGGPLDMMLGLDGRKPVTQELAVINYVTGLVTLNLYKNGNPDPPALGQVIWVRYGWRPPRLRDARIKVKIGGRKEWVSVRELQDAFNRSDRPWPDQPGGHCQGPCRH